MQNRNKLDPELIRESTIEELQKRVIDLSSEKSELIDCIERRSLEISSKKDFDHLQYELKERTLELTALQREFDEYRSAYERKVTNAARESIAEEDVEDGISERDGRELIDILKQKLSFLSEEKFKLMEELESIKSSDRAGSRNEGSEEEKKNLEEQLTMCKDDNERLKKELQSVLEKAASDGKRIEVLSLKEGKQNMLALEIADYERTIETLSREQEEQSSLLISKDEYISSMDERLQSVVTEKTALEQDKKVLGLKFDKLKVLYGKLKHELTAKAKKYEEKDKEIYVSSLQAEEVKKEMDSYKVEIAALENKLSAVMSENETSQMGYRRAQKALERALEDAYDAHRITKSELADLHKEYSAFRIRAHDILKKNSKSDKEKSKDKEEIMQLREDARERDAAVEELKGDNDKLSIGKFYRAETCRLSGLLRALLCRIAAVANKVRVRGERPFVDN